MSHQKRGEGDLKGTEFQNLEVKYGIISSFEGRSLLLVSKTEQHNEFIQLGTRITMLSCIGVLSVSVSVSACVCARARVFPCRRRVDVCSCDTLFDTRQTSYYIFKGPLK